MDSPAPSEPPELPKGYVPLPPTNPTRRGRISAVSASVAFGLACLAVLLMSAEVITGLIIQAQAQARAIQYALGGPNPPEPLPLQDPLGISALLISSVAFATGWMALSHAQHSPLQQAGRRRAIGLAMAAMAIGGLTVVALLCGNALIDFGNTISLR